MNSCIAQGCLVSEALLAVVLDSTSLAMNIALDKGRFGTARACDDDVGAAAYACAYLRRLRTPSEETQHGIGLRLW